MTKKRLQFYNSSFKFFFQYNRCNTSILNSNSREDEVIIVHFTNETEIDFDKIFNRGKNRTFRDKVYFRFIRKTEAASIDEKRIDADTTLPH